MFQIGFKYFPFVNVTLNPKRVCKNLKGLKIVQLSDLHLSTKVRIGYLEKLIHKVNEQEADLVVITGDIIQTKVLKLNRLLSVFKGLKAPAYYVSGNHDIVYGHRELRIQLEKNGVICLDNKIETLIFKGQKLQLVGLADRYSFVLGKKRPIKELFSKLDANLFTILLAHQPRDAEYIKNNRIDIQLSGHTHGGQVFPFTIIVKLFQKYFAGLYEHNDTIIFVTRGLGYWGVNLRFASPSEIPVITIE